MEHLLISACLLGAQCRYDGQSKPVLEMVALSEQFDLVPLCPEQLGGLPAHKLHCSVLAEEAVKSAVQDYYERNNIPYDKSKFPKQEDCESCRMV